MKATLEFNLNEPDDVMAHLRCVKATDLALALWEIQQYIGKLSREEEQINIENLLSDVNCFIEERGLILSDLME